ncbi:kinase-like protein [Athelia psychrophila]|uniref:Kinase-like protein n=1 Tax=Athelia psychrophila TaxID=1759441 RepID=A0A166SZR0_9AGAM|nr:kinase-like protein [Fibularhizoctonia sp. CBS 109695]
MPTVKRVPKTHSESSHASTSTSYLKPSHAHSNALPPLLDLTGEIKRQSQSAQRGGGFADVHKALWGRENVAVKVLRWNLDDEIDRLKKKKRLHREIRVWQRLEHPNILPLYGITQDFGLYPSMVCPWLEQGDLNKYLARKHDTLSLPHRFQLLGGICDGLEYLHKSSVVHGDLTGSNVLITAAGTPRLADFGLSKVMAEFDGTSYMTGTGGAVRWAAFELYHMYGDDEEPRPALISTKSDIYSFGSIILQMLSGKIPYHYVRAQAAVVILVHSGTLPRRPKRVRGLSDDRVWAFINRCWAAPAQRPTIADVSAFVRGYHARLVSHPVDPVAPWYDQDAVEVRLSFTVHSAIF